MLRRAGRSLRTHRQARVQKLKCGTLAVRHVSWSIATLSARPARQGLAHADRRVVNRRERTAMIYTLAGFTHELGVRIFEFVGTDEGKTKHEYHVRADIGLIQRYGIRVQDLPLLCRRLLEQLSADDERRTLTYTEADMRGYAEFCAARDALSEKKKVRKPAVSPTGGGWHQNPIRLGPSLE